MKSKILSGHLAAFVTILIWGTTFISTKVLLKTFTPVEILLIRFLIGYAALWCVRPRLLKVKDKKQEWYFAAAGLCGITLYYLLENMALTYTLASNVGVIISIAPFFTALFAWLFLHERRPSGRFFLGFFIAMAGIALLSFGKEAVLQFDPTGDFLAVIAAVLWAAYSILTKKISAFGHHTVLVTRRTFFYGLLFMAPVSLFMGVQVHMQDFLSPNVLPNLLFLGIGASALCFVTWNIAVKRLGSVKTSLYIYMVPVITASASALILHEKMTMMVIGGIALTLTGLLLSQDRPPKKETIILGTELGEKRDGD